MSTGFSIFSLLHNFFIYFRKNSLRRLCVMNKYATALPQPNPKRAAPIPRSSPQSIFDFSTKDVNLRRFSWEAGIYRPR